MFIFLKKKYPISLDFKRGIRDAFIVSLFVFVFLLIFQPFGLSTTRPDLRIYLILGYTCVCFIIISGNCFIPVLFKKIFFEENWTVYKHILWRIWMIFTIAAGNYLFACIFNRIYDFFRLDLNTFLLFILVTFLIAIIPMSLYSLYDYNRLLKKHLNTANDISLRLSSSALFSIEKTKLIKDFYVILFSENKNEEFNIDFNRLLYISSEDNYVGIVYEDDNRLKKHLLRNSLKNIESQITNHPFLVRCHRAHIVNTSKIIKASGNAQGLILNLEGTDYKIPVSRSYYKEFKRILSLS